MFEWLSSPEAWISLLTLTGLEIVLGIDNIMPTPAGSESEMISLFSGSFNKSIAGFYVFYL